MLILYIAWLPRTSRTTSTVLAHGRHTLLVNLPHGHQVSELLRKLADQNRRLKSDPNVAADY